MNNQMVHYFIKYILILAIGTVIAQDQDQLTANGNKLFSKNEYTKAEVKYRKENALNPLHTISKYNLGNTIYTQKQYPEAIAAYHQVIQTSKDKAELHKTFHNLGNIFMKQKKYTEAVSAYKNALKNNPRDEETRYNFALAKTLLKDNPPPQKQENKKENEKKKDPKDKEDKKDKKKKEEEKGDDSKDQSEDQKEKQNKEGEKEGKFSKQRMESLLEAINNEEKKIQNKMIKQKTKGRPIQQEKNW